MEIHPYAWLITTPLTIAMVQLCFQPANNAIKQWWLSLRAMEAEAWFRLGRGYSEPEFSPAFKVGYASAIGIFAAISIASFCVFIEVIPGRI